MQSTLAAPAIGRKHTSNITKGFVYIREKIIIIMINIKVELKHSMPDLYNHENVRLRSSVARFRH